MTSFERVKEILDNSIGEPNVEIGRHGAFWRVRTPDELPKSVYDEKLIEPGDGANSNLVKALKGEYPFDGSSFKRMPSRRPAVPDTQIDEIVAWINSLD